MEKIIKGTKKVMTALIVTIIAFLWLYAACESASNLFK